MQLWDKKRASKTLGLAASIAALLLLVILTGCTTQNPQSADEANNTETPKAEEASSASESVSASTFTTPSDATPSTAGKLHVEGTQLVSDNGRPVQLRGISTHGLSWFPEFVNQQLFTELRTDWNANAIRLAMYTAEYDGYNTGGNKAQLRKLVLDGVKYATDADLYAIVDWHTLSDNDPNTYADSAMAFFDEISKKLANNNNVIYEICNEPNGNTTWATVKAYAERVIPVIRKNDPNAVILVGTPEWSQRIDQAADDPLEFENVMYTLHFYAATHQQDLRDRLKEAVNKGLPVFVSEFGICDASGNGAIDKKSANAWVSLMDKLNVSYICWNLSNKDEASALIKSGVSKTSDFSYSDLSGEGKWLYNVLHSNRS